VKEEAKVALAVVKLEVNTIPPFSLPPFCQ
jgi:hypothetical protein